MSFNITHYTFSRDNPHPSLDVNLWWFAFDGLSFMNNNDKTFN